MRKRAQQQQPHVGISGKACGSSLLVIAALCVLSAPALAAPAYSRGIQNLTVPFSEAVRRAEQALPAEDYSITYRGGENRDRVIIALPFTVEGIHNGGTKPEHDRQATRRWLRRWPPSATPRPGAPALALDS